jgi:hypothetical protein
MSTSAYSTTSSLVMLRTTASSVPQYAGPSCSSILLRVSAVFLSYVCIRRPPCQQHQVCRKYFLGQWDAMSPLRVGLGSTSGGTRNDMLHRQPNQPRCPAASRSSPGFSLVRYLDASKISAGDELGRAVCLPWYVLTEHTSHFFC